MIKRIIVFFLVSLLTGSLYAQTDFKQQYLNGKNFFKEGKYNLAMETLKKIIPYDQNNPYSEYASFYYAVSAYNQGYASVAKGQFNQIKNLYPKWDKMDDVNFWLAKILFDNKDYFQGLKLLDQLHDPKLLQDAALLKQQVLSKIQDQETLRMMNEEYSKDEIIAKLLAKSLVKTAGTPEDRATLEILIKKYNLNKAEYIPEAPKSFFKDKYSVSVLFPFMINTLDASPSKKRNQLVLDIYEGMKLAVDTLNKLGVNISLRAYDTDRSVEKIKKILDTEELKATDLIVGPIYQEENKIVQDFSVKNQINVINPVSNNSENIGTNPYAFLFQPSFETLGKKSADFIAAQTARRKSCMVFYGTSRRDSVLAANFVQKAGQNGLRVVLTQKIAKEGAAKILNILATPTEFDEFKYPSQFTLKKDSIGSIFVASDDALIFTKVVSGVETRADSILVVGSENWLEQADYEKYQRLGIVLASPNYTSLSNHNYQRFMSRFIKVHGRTPSGYAKIGYEFMLFVGQQLKANGVYFQDGLNKENFIPGVLSQGYNFQLNRDNQQVPFIKFDEGELKLSGK